MKKVILFLLSFSILTCLFVFVFYLVNSSPISSTSQTKVFVINKGDSLDIIATRLQQNGLIKNGLVFKLNTYFLGLHDKLRAGSFNLDTSMDNQQIARSLITGGSHDMWIQIIEGWRNEEIASYLEENNFFDAKSFLYIAKGSQGYIFPDTYSIPQTKDIDFFIDKTKQNFDQKYSKAVDNATKQIGQTEAIIVASLVEREARTLESKQMVAGILYNRLELGMPLQVDASIQYASDSQNSPQSFWQPVTKANLSIDSPFNTYKNPGLPPAPICNPGYDSIYAALVPTESDYIYYITGNDNKMHFATTLEEHNQNISQYL